MMLFFALAFGCNTPPQDHHRLPATCIFGVANCAPSSHDGHRTAAFPGA